MRNPVASGTQLVDFEHRMGLGMQDKQLAEERRSLVPFLDLVVRPPEVVDSAVVGNLHGLHDLNHHVHDLRHDLFHAQNLHVHHVRRLHVARALHSLDDRTSSVRC